MTKPVLHALVGYECPFGVVAGAKVHTLEDAVDYIPFGFVVLVDPQDQEDLVRFEQWERAAKGQAIIRRECA